MSCECLGVGTGQERAFGLADEVRRGLGRTGDIRAVTMHGAVGAPVPLWGDQKMKKL